MTPCSFVFAPQRKREARVYAQQHACVYTYIYMPIHARKACFAVCINLMLLTSAVVSSVYHGWCVSVCLCVCVLSVLMYMYMCVYMCARVYFQPRTHAALVSHLCGGFRFASIKPKDTLIYTAKAFLDKLADRACLVLCLCFERVSLYVVNVCFCWKSTSAATPQAFAVSTLRRL